MAKKRKASRVPEAPSGPRDYDANDAQLGPITTYEDVADEQEQYFLDQDKIMLNAEQGTKRQRREQNEAELLELSDDEVLGADPDDSDNEEAEDPSDRRKKKKKAKKAAAKKAREAAATNDSDDDGDNSGKKSAEEEGDQGWWGTSKSEYYDGETIETEANALEEEAEARRLQKKQLSRMKAEDFFDMDEWTTAGAKDETKRGADSAAVKLTTRTNKEEIDSMSSEEKTKFLQDYYPEFDLLCDDFVELEPLMNEYKALAEGKPSESLEVVQFRALSCYVATICMYLSLFMSPSRDSPNGNRYIMDPDELHDHEVMQYLVDTRETWERVKRLQARRAAKAKKEAALAAEEDKIATAKSVLAAVAAAESEMAKAKSQKKSKKSAEADASDKAATATKKAKKDKKGKSNATSRELEDSMADLAALLSNKKSKKVKKTATAARRNGDDSDDLSDLGEEDAIDARTAEENLKRKKSLGFYTSQIMQKSNMRSGASTQAGGDADIPYRERFRDRQARLEAAAARHAEAPIQPGEELGGSDDDDDDGASDAEGDAEKAANLAYYNSIVKAHGAKMDVKAARKAAIEAGKLDRVVPDSLQDKDGRRQLTWEIEKNKGLSHKTLKEKKNNPRVKKRVKFEKKKKQLASMRAVYKPVDRENYQGERTGISTGLIRSIKLD
ncbi:something about silencing protein 10 [Sporothrix curviconia]|uniref:Something about silencing protein 10 n=1 Tax=Sporothrix curviconia TaxID=1260050 RepID=A0ABP0BPB4_9PEZI